MANLLESTETDFPYPNSNDLGIREGAAGSTLSPRRYREHCWAREPGAGGSRDGAAVVSGSARPGAVCGDRQCCSRKLVATFRSLFEALRASKASPLENPISMSRATWTETRPETR